MIPLTLAAGSYDPKATGSAPGPRNDQSEPEVDLPGSEYGPLELLDDKDSDEGTNDKDDSSSGGTGNRSGEVSSTGGGNGSSIGISGGNGSGSSGTCASSQISMSRAGARAAHTCLDPSTAHSNPMAGSPLGNRAGS